MLHSAFRNERHFCILPFVTKGKNVLFTFRLINMPFVTKGIFAFCLSLRKQKCAFRLSSHKYAFCNERHFCILPFVTKGKNVHFAFRLINMPFVYEINTK